MKIECEFKIIHHKIPRYSCKVKSAAITEPKTRITAFIGNHLDGKSDQDVTEIEFEGTIVNFFPRGLPASFPNLNFLKVVNCGLKKISREDFIGLENLYEINFDRNEIESLPTNLFQDMRKLKNIFFYKNKLKFISPELMRPLENNGLASVSLTDNASIDASWNYFHPSPQCKTFEDFLNIIKISCQKPIEADENLTLGKFSDNFLKQFEKLWYSRKFVDFVIVAGTKEFQVHKCVLAAQSSVFTAVFNNEMQESLSNRMTIVDFTSAAVGEFLRFLYTGHLFPGETNSMELFRLSALYDVASLKSITKQIVLKNLNESNALDIFVLGYLYSTDDMKALALLEIRKAFPISEFAQSFADNPEKLKKLIEAKCKMVQKIQEAQNEFDQVVKEIQQYN